MFKINSACSIFVTAIRVGPNLFSITIAIKVVHSPTVVVSSVHGTNIRKCRNNRGNTPRATGGIMKSHHPTTAAIGINVEHNSTAAIGVNNDIAQFIALCYH